MDRLTLSFTELALAFLTCLFSFYVHVCGTALFPAGYMYLKGEMAAQILADTPLSKSDVCWKVTTKEEEPLVLHFVTCRPHSQTAPSPVIFQGLPLLVVT